MTDPVDFQERRLARYELTETVNVLDVNQGTVLGTLVNIHEEGLLIVGKDSIRSDHVYQIALCLPDQVCEGQKVALGVDCLWVREAGDSSMQWSGCQIIDLSDAARVQIQQLVDQLGRR